MVTWESWERIFFSKNVDLAKQRINEALFEKLDVNLIGERTCKNIILYLFLSNLFWVILC